MPSHDSKPNAVIASILTTLPILLLIPAFVLGAYSASIKDWSWHTNYNENNADAPTNITHRSPFISCSLETMFDPNGTSSAYFVETCNSLRKPNGLCYGNGTTIGSDNAHFCSQLALSARMLYAGVALVGVALVVVLVLTATTLPQIVSKGAYRDDLFYLPLAPTSSQARSHHNHHSPSPTVQRAAVQSITAYLTLLLRLAAVFGGIILLLGTVLATNTLVNINFPIGDWYSTGDPLTTSIIAQDHQGPWMMGRAVGLSVAGAALAIVAGAVAGAVWEGPKIGIVGKDEGRQEHGRSDPTPRREDHGFVESKQTTEPYEA